MSDEKTNQQLQQEIEELRLKLQEILRTTSAEAQQLAAELDAVFAAMPDGILFYDANGQPRRINEAAISLIGHNIAGISDEQLAAVLKRLDTRLEDGRPLMVDDMPTRKVMRGETVQGLIIHMTNDAGQDTIVEVNAAPVATGGAVAVWRDITERMWAEEGLQASEARLRATLDSIVDEVWILDAEGRFVLINNAAMRHMGLAAREQAWRTLSEALEQLEIYYPDGTPRPPEASPLARALAGEIISGEQEIVRHLSTGELRDQEASCAPIHDAKGQTIGAVCTIRDITEHKKAEAALLQSNQRLAAVTNTPFIAIGIADAAGRILECNDALVNLFGYSRDEILGRGLTWSQLTAPQSRQLDERILTQLQSSDKIDPFEKEFLHKDSSCVPALVSITRLSEKSGEYVTFILSQRQRKS